MLERFEPPFGPVTHTEREDLRDANELSQVFAEQGFRLKPELESALAEEAEHQDIRRGGGFLQAARMISGFINTPRSYRDIGLFDDELIQNYSAQREQRHAAGQPEISRNILLDDLRPLQAAVRSLEHEESQVLANILFDIVARYEPDQYDHVLFNRNPEERFAADVPRMGTCTTAETYFLEFSYNHDMFKWRGGESSHMNVIVDDDNNPLMLEKVGLGDPHSCITVQEVVLNNVRLPAGTLLGVGYNTDVIDQRPVEPNPSNRKLIKPNTRIIQASQCGAFKYLRLSSLVISPDRRATALARLMEIQEGFPMAKHADIDVLYLDALSLVDSTKHREEMDRWLEKINHQRKAKGWDPL